MKKTTLRLISALLSVSMIAGAFTGLAKNSPYIMPEQTNIQGPQVLKKKLPNK